MIALLNQRGVNTTSMLTYGGLAEVLVVGTGTTAGFSFGHALAAVHFKRGYILGTKWSLLT